MRFLRGVSAPANPERRRGKRNPNNQPTLRRNTLLNHLHTHMEFPAGSLLTRLTKFSTPTNTTRSWDRERKNKNWDMEGKRKTSNPPYSFKCEN